jgi:hypothetical protein
MLTPAQLQEDYIIFHSLFQKMSFENQVAKTAISVAGSKPKIERVAVVCHITCFRTSAKKLHNATNAALGPIHMQDLSSSQHICPTAKASTPWSRQ